MIFQVYCDESRQTKERYMVLGGVIIAASFLPDFNAAMAEFRREQNMHAELKWTKVSNQKIKEYRRFVDYYFEVHDARKADFHAMIVDRSKVDHDKHSGGDKEKGFYKFFYQLLLHRFGKNYRASRSEARFQVILDHRTFSYPLGQLLTILNHGLKSRYGIGTRPFVSIEPRDSKKSEVLQINDILIGAVGFQKNDRELLSESRAAKIELAAYIAEKANLDDLKESSSYDRRRFTLWNIRLQ